MSCTRDWWICLCGLVLLACGDVEESSLIERAGEPNTASQVRRISVQAVSSPPVSMTRFAFHTDHILRLELERNVRVLRSRSRASDKDWPRSSVRFHL